MDSACPKGLRCTYGNVCWKPGGGSPPCEEDKDCYFGEYCARDRCLVDDCESDADCAGANICLPPGDGSCRTGCRASSDAPSRLTCPAGEVCNANNRCELPGCQPGECGPYRTCRQSLSPPRCKYTGACGDAEGTEPQAVCDAYAAQTDARDILICVDGQCAVPNCAEDTDCPPDEICERRADESNRCRPGCRCTNAAEVDGCDRDCSFGEFCENGSAQTAQSPSYSCSRNECASDAECPDGEVCLPSGACQPTCEDRMDCTGGELCAGDPSVCKLCDPSGSSELACPDPETCVLDLKPMAKGLGLCKEVETCPADQFDPHYCRAESADLLKDIASLPASVETTFCQENTGGTSAMCGRKSGEWFTVAPPIGGELVVMLVYPEGTTTRDGRSVTTGNLGIELIAPSGETVDVSDSPASGTEDDDGREAVTTNIVKGDTIYIHVFGSLSSDLDHLSYELRISTR